ncbi:MAG: hypothetical protein EOR68_08430 [Mesorhizobium sp.]|uniref:hypothetical protein n=1 Tax=Mesorhizobium sp. TaxID=1871066 RepID=UPI000FE5045A|nr:hypothetical protein [Mesorhizobium sp.]RWM02123.1 MAG: hypothetical protein EOR68_08430 [Mesorhizobium sp.]
MSKIGYNILFYCCCVTLAAIVLLPTYREVICTTAPVAACAQGWLGALSGWAAFAGALAALPYLAGQVREARRQTEFIVGDAMPTANMHDPRETRIENAFSSRLKIVNWNRHPILIRRITLVAPSTVTLFGVEVEDHDAGRRGVLQQEYKRGRMYVPGWVDRTRTPTVAEFDLTFSTEVPALIEVAENNLVRLPVTLAIEITVADARHRIETLIVERPDALVLAG